MKQRVRAKDRVGQRFGRLVVISIPGKNRHGQSQIACKCDCGSYTVVDCGSVVTGKTISCGCVRSEKTIKRNTVHGMSASSEYVVWQSMLNRCRNIKDREYRNYGGRGITVCDRWLSFENFYADMGQRPSKEHSIDRIDNNGNYCSENCRWATTKEQSRNRRNNNTICYGGITKVLVDWAIYKGIDYDCLRARLKKGWTVEEALETPSGVRRASNQ